MFISFSFGGNVHQALSYINKLKCAQFLFQVVAFDSSCILIFRVPAREDRISVRQELGLQYQSD